MIFACLYIYIGDAIIFFSYISAIILHELGHSVVAKILGYKLKSICLQPYGAQLNLNEKVINSNDDIKIAIAGPITNLMLLVIVVSCWWLWPDTYSYTLYFAYANMITCMFNLLPLVPLDGSRILLAISDKWNKRRKLIKILNAVNVICSMLFVVLFIVSFFDKINYTFMLMAIFIFAGAFENNDNYVYAPIYKFEKQKYLSKKSIPVRAICINQNYDKQKLLRFANSNYYTILYVVDSKMRIIKIITENQFEKYFLE